MKLFITSIFITIISLVIFSCASSTGSRYSKSETEKKSDAVDLNSESNLNTTLKEDFDITPYKTKIDIPDKKQTNVNSSKTVWFEYDSNSDNIKKKILTGTAEGFRVLVLNTDNIEEANQLKADVNDKVDKNEVYVDFEPPFYKVKVGDFSDQKTADNIRFKLNQLGYKEAKVIKDKINIFK